jgi:hypothetical protein
LATRAGTTGPQLFLQLEIPSDKTSAFNQCPRLLATMALATMLLSCLGRPDCFPVEEARKQIGEIKCINGKLVPVKQGKRGVQSWICVTTLACTALRSQN